MNRTVVGSVTSVIGRIPILDLEPAVDCGARPVKAVAGETFAVSATVFREGHGLIGVAAVLRDPERNRGPLVRMRELAPGTDRYGADVTVTAEGLWRFQDAVRLMQPMVERRPLDEAVALRYLALTAQAGRVDDGLRVHRRFAASAGPAYRVKAGRILMDLGKYPDAVTEYEAVLAAAPGDGDDAVAARLALAQLYDWTGAGEPALKQWESLMRARPRDPRVLREVGRRSLAMSRNEVALRAYR